MYSEGPRYQKLLSSSSQRVQLNRMSEGEDKHGGVLSMWVGVEGGLLLRAVLINWMAREGSP